MHEPAYLGYQSATEYLCRERYFSGAVPFGWEFFAEQKPVAPSERTCRVRSLPKGCPSNEAIASLLEGPLRGMTAPLHVLVPRRGDCYRSELRIGHLWSSVIPAGSFARLSDYGYISSPEFCILQLARMLSLVELVRLIDEWCGSYALAPCPGDPYRNAPPLTSVAYLRPFLARAQEAGVRGSRDALRALHYAADGSASPMETILSLLLCLPCKLGGYGLPLARFNERPRRLPTAGKDARALHRCDLLWKEAGVAVEYEGEKSHEGTCQVTKDSVRDNALAVQGQALIKVTKTQLWHVESFDVVARQIADLLGHRLRPDRRPGDWELRRARLRWELLPTRDSDKSHEAVGRHGDDGLNPWRRPL